MSPLQQLEASGSHFEVGFSIGESFASQIHRALDNYAFLQKRILPYHHTPEGKARYQELLGLHRTRYPDYVAELEGLAQGARRSLEDLFLVNLRGEYAGLLAGADRGCFDCALVTDEAALIGHNEDGSPAFRGNTYLVHAQVKGKPSFTAFSYPGFLCGNAFGFNAEGLCFSCDNVQPRKGKVGVGRHFVARSLLEARSVDDAIKRVTVPGRASGFAYTIGSVPERRIVYVEVAPQTFRVVEIQGWYVHANHYLELTDVDQAIAPSSQARVERAKAILEDSPPLDAGGVLFILGDQVHGEYPILRSATPPDRSATLCTALFDLDARRLRIYTDDLTQAPGEFVELNLEDPGL